MKTLNFILLLTVLLSCGDDNFRKVEKLSGFRVLGIKADQPEIMDSFDGTSVDLDIIVSYVNWNTQPVDVEAISCIDPGVGYGAEVNCDHDPSAIPTSFSFNFGSIGSASSFTGVINRSVNIPGNLLTGRSARDQFNGVAYLTIFIFEVDGETHKVFKRIVVTNRGSLNSNPSADNIQLNGADISSFPLNGDILSISTLGLPETYTYRTVENIDETRTEEFQVAWYVSEGKLSRSKTYVGEETEYDKSEATSISSVVVAIVRDERGGLDYQIFSPPGF
jgi:hypothetical protein